MVRHTMDEMMEMCLRRALHGYTGAAGRWDQLRAAGVSDEDLLAHVAREFGSYGGSSTPVWYEQWGGSNPRIRVGKTTVSGQRLLALARKVLAIPAPQDGPQMSLW